MPRFAPILYAALCSPATNAVLLAGSPLRFDMPYALCFSINKPHRILIAVPVILHNRISRISDPLAIDDKLIGLLATKERDGNSPPISTP